MPNISPRMNAIKEARDEFERRQRLGTISRSAIFKAQFCASDREGHNLNLPMRVSVIDGATGEHLGITVDYLPTIGDPGMRREEREVMEALAR